MPLPAKIDPILPLDRANPVAMPCLPPWLANSLNALNLASFSRPTILESEAPTPMQRALIERHVSELSAAETAVDLDAAMLKVTELLVSFPSAALGETAAKAKARGYMTALEDMPAWAVSEACRRWIRAECGDANYDFAPSAPRLRQIADNIRAPLRWRRVALEKLLSAAVQREYSREHCVGMLQKLANVFKGITNPSEAAE